MPKKENADSEQSAEFDLKHRVTGAAVLLFLGALVLPWLLGPPSEASKVEVSSALSANSVVEPANIIVDTNNANTNIDIGNVEETVYISKITPLDARGNSDLVNAASQAAASTQLDSSVGASDQDSTDGDSSGALQELVREQNAALESAEKASKAAKDKAAKDNAAQALKQAKKDSKTADLQYAKREQELQAALAAELKPKKANPIDVGWVVQVGLFTEKSRAIALISELKNKGFSASSSVVDTNRGKNTGTRVWLGPFTKRISAINEQKRLKSKAGKEGFIRVYP